jgi:lysozyme family protein
MTTDEFQRSLARVLIHEGGYANNPKDPGGATMRGVTQRVYDAYRAKLGQAPRPVRQIDDAELQSIYRRNYWNVVKGDALPPGVSYVVFDGAVNSGPTQAIKWLQRALGVADDGIIGPATLNAAMNANAAELIDQISYQRLAFLKRLSTWGTFGKGWSERVADVQSTGHSWAVGVPALSPKPTTAPAPHASTPAPAAQPHGDWLNTFMALISSVFGAKQ